MNIWIVNQYAIPPSQAGGTRHFGLARELVRLGHEVTLIGASFDYTTRRETRLAPGEAWKIEEVEGVRFVWLRVPGYSGNTLARMWSMAAFGWRVFSGASAWPVSPPDVILGSSPHLFGALAAERLAARFGVPFVLEVRDLWPRSLVEVAGVSARHPVVKAFELIERHLYRRAAWFISLLPGASTHMTAMGVPADRITWLPNSVDLARVPLPSEPPEGAFTVAYAGQHGVANALDSILDAAAILKRQGQDAIRFRFIGDGPEKPRLEQRARDEGLSAVSFEPALPKDRIYDALAGAHAFIVTLRDIDLYRFGISLNKLYDYLAMARPTVFGARALNNPIDEAEAGITVPPEDASAMAEALKRLAYMDSASRWAMGLRGRRFVEENYDTGRLARRLEQILTGVVGSSHVGPADASRPGEVMDR